MIIDFKLIMENNGVKVLEIFDLLDYPNMLDLMQKLEKYKNYKFYPNDRLIFIHGDTEYIELGIRFDLFNLQKIISKSNIPNFACIILSQQDISKELEIYKNLTTELMPIGYINVEVHLIHLDSYDIENRKQELNNTLLEKQFIFLSNKPKSHRTFLFSWLDHNNLLDKGIVSFKNIDFVNQIKSFEFKEPSTPPNVTILQVYPFARSNDIWYPKDQTLKLIFSKQVKDQYKNFTEIQDTKINNNNPLIIQKSFCYISNETTFNYPGVFTSEKSFKSFSAMRPMISYGCSGILSKLKKFGFKTWDRWWSEDYDNIEDPEQRFLAVTNLIKQISNFSLDECKAMLADMEDVLVHNRDLYIDNFVNYQIKNLKNQTINNINRLSKK